MASFSSIVVMGNLTRDPEVRNAGGKEVTKISIALNKKRGDKEYTVFIEAELWEKQAEFVIRWFRKGDAIIIQGELDHEEWDDANTGKKRTKHLIRNCRASFAGGKKDGGTGSGDSSNQRSQGSQGHQGSSSSGDTLSEDDCPF